MHPFKLAFYRTLGWIRRRFPSTYRQRAPFAVVRESDVPDELESDCIYLIGEGEHLWSAAMKCPGGCGTVLEMNLVPDMRPLWHVALDAKGTVTIEPSIWRKRDCGCHFRITKGRVVWY